ATAPHPPTPAPPPPGEHPPQSLPHTSPTHLHPPNLGNIRRNRYRKPAPHKKLGRGNRQVTAIRASRREGVRTYRNHAIAALATSTRPVTTLVRPACIAERCSSVRSARPLSPIAAVAPIDTAAPMARYKGVS